MVCEGGWVWCVREGRVGVVCEGGREGVVWCVRVGRVGVVCEGGREGG